MAGLPYNELLLRTDETDAAMQKKSGHGFDCLIIAAGRGSRLASRAASKPLLEVGGRALIDRTIEAARAAGARRFVVVTGYAGGTVEAHLRARAAAEGLAVATVRNDEWEKENGLSVLKAKGLVGDRFLLVMADHIFDPALLDGLRCRPVGSDEVILAVDRRTRDHPFADLDDVTKVRDKDGRIEAIGKNLAAYNAFDTGAFLCTPALFEALETSQRAGDYSLSGGIKVLAARGRARTWDAGAAFWLDVDDAAALAKAEAAVAAGLDGAGVRSGGIRRFPHWARILLSGAGLILLAFLLLKVGVATVLEHLARFGPWFLVIIAISLVWLFLQAWAWHIIQAAHFRPIPLSRLYRVKIISDSLNTLIPTANVGGDAARPFLVRGHAPLAETIPGVLADKTVEALAAAIFLVTGFLLSLLLVRLPAWMNTAALVCLALTAAGIAFFVVLQMKGLRWSLERLAKVVPSLRAFASRTERSLGELDSNLRLVYRGLRPQTAAALGLHYVARLLGAVEVFVILRVLGTPATPFQALFTSTGVTLFNTAFFVVPGQFGVMETAHVLMLQSLGFAAAIGLSLGVIRRVRKLVTSSIGLALYASHKTPPGDAGSR
jgi:1L-myo-inositol 1-phosphate cytidylyltransferase